MESMVSKNFWNKKKVLITGHTGFKGSWLSYLLNFYGADLYGISLPKYKNDKTSLIELKSLDIKSYYFDICNSKKLQKVMNEIKPEIIFHLAAQSLVLESYKDPKKTFDTNINGTANILFSSSVTDNVKTIINITTDKVYKNRNQNKSFKEDDELGGSDPYSASKACADIMSQSIMQLPSINNLSICNVRAGNVIGGGDWSKHRLVPDIVKSYKNGKNLPIRNPSSVRPWQFVLEPLIGYMILAEKSFKNPKKFNGVWNFGPNNKNIFTVQEIVNYSKKYFNKKLKTNVVHSSYSESNFLKIDSTKANNFLKWKNKLSLTKTLELTFLWYENFLNGNDMNSYTQQQINNFLKLYRE